MPSKAPVEQQITSETNTVTITTITPVATGTRVTVVVSETTTNIVTNASARTARTKERVTRASSR